MCYCIIMQWSKSQRRESQRDEGIVSTCVWPMRIMKASNFCKIPRDRFICRLVGCGICERMSFSVAASCACVVIRRTVESVCIIIVVLWAILVVCQCSDCLVFSTIWSLWVSRQVFSWKKVLTSLIFSHGSPNYQSCCWPLVY